MNQISTCNYVYINIKIIIYAFKETGCKKERLSQILTVIEVNTTLAQDCSNCDSTCLVHVIHQLLKQIMYFCTHIHGLQK